MKSYLNRLGPNSLAVFLFHGVIHSNDCCVRNYTRKHLLADEFVQFLQRLKSVGRPLGMGQALSLIHNGAPFPDNAFAITFDDGFENNASVAAPILDDLGIPATFYISTAFVEEGGMSWIDRFEYGFEKTQRVELRLPWRDRPAVAESREEKITLLSEIRREVKSRREIDANELACDALRGLGIHSVQGDHPLDKKLSWQQVRELNDHALFTVGGHTHSHAIMSYLSSEQLAAEIDTSLRLLLLRAGVGPMHYSYPEGQGEHFSPAVISALKLRGVECCPTAMDGVNPPGTDPFMLRRIAVERICAE